MNPSKLFFHFIAAFATAATVIEALIKGADKIKRVTIDQLDGTVSVGDGVTATPTARVVGPLFSQEARGQFGKAVVYGRRRGQNVVRAYGVPNNPQTPGQIAVRIRLAVTGRITQATRVGDLKYATETASVIQFYRTRVREGEVWNSALVREMQGPGNATYIAQLAAYEAETQSVQDLWIAAAAAAPINLVDYVREGTTVENGFMLYLLQYTLGQGGYGSFDSDTPNPMVSA